jgi:hypothetical protein
MPLTVTTTRKVSGIPAERAGQVTVGSRKRPRNGYGEWRQVPVFEHADFGFAFGLG